MRFVIIENLHLQFWNILRVSQYIAQRETGLSWSLIASFWTYHCPYMHTYTHTLPNMSCCELESQLRFKKNAESSQKRNLLSNTGRNMMSEQRAGTKRSILDWFIRQYKRNTDPGVCSVYISFIGAEVVGSDTELMPRAQLKLRRQYCWIWVLMLCFQVSSAWWTSTITSKWAAHEWGWNKQIWLIVLCIIVHFDL